MAGTQDVRDAVARVVGGTAPQPVNNPRWFSGVDTGDGTGVAGVLGCYSAAQANLMTVAGSGAVGSAVGMVLLGPGNLHYPTSPDSLVPSQEYIFDNLRLLLVIPRSDPEIEDAILAPFRDSVTAAFRSHMTLFGTANVIQAPVTAWRNVVWKSGGGDLVGWEMTIRVFRVSVVTYTP